MRVLFCLLVALLPVSALAADNLGAPTGVLTPGKYVSEDPEKILTDVEIKPWGDRLMLSAEMDYLTGQPPQKIKVLLRKFEDDFAGPVYSAVTYVTTVSSYTGWYCSFQVIFKIQAYERGFLVMRNGPHAFDLDYCIEHGRQWVPIEKPFVLAPVPSNPQ